MIKSAGLKSNDVCAMKQYRFRLQKVETSSETKKLTDYIEAKCFAKFFFVISVARRHAIITGCRITFFTWN